MNFRLIKKRRAKITDFLDSETRARRTSDAPRSNTSNVTDGMRKRCEYVHEYRFEDIHQNKTKHILRNASRPYSLNDLEMYILRE